ncbi:MAG: hypothetical protein IH597_16685 [Bacteroidales bacterium]|nr:hypothetical protein [Bacteroidales bacterium]
MSRSAKEKKYDNKTAKYVVGKVPAEKPDSIATDPYQVYKEEDLKKITGRRENARPDS